jgi:hypothetical protein
MEVVAVNEFEFDLLLLTHKNNQTSRLMLYRFDRNFIQAIQDKLN